MRTCSSYSYALVGYSANSRLTPRGPIWISSRCGKTPNLTFLFSSLRKRSTRSFNSPEGRSRQRTIAADVMAVTHFGGDAVCQDLSHTFSFSFLFVDLPYAAT